MNIPSLWPRPEFAFFQMWGIPALPFGTAFAHCSFLRLAPDAVLRHPVFRE
jgi:hypothetical protein